ncbi:hypothetical protein, partial [Nostoc sp. T09]|uniref:hypothetical protein n=1 Tax=Nostoc sp. T09 TaxID=1932621 RepID=UPI0015C5144D
PHSPIPPNVRILALLNRCSRGYRRVPLRGTPVHASRYPAGSRFRRLQVWRPNASAPLCRRHFLQVGEPAQRSASGNPSTGLAHRYANIKQCLVLAVRF